jgi:hypothetical protein
MKSFCVTLLMAVLAVASFAQDKVINDPNAEVRAVGAFHAIKVSTGIRLVMKQGTEDAVAISASDKEVRDHIKTEVVNGVLKIYVDVKPWEVGRWTKPWQRTGPLKAYVSFKNIDNFEGSSGAIATIDGSLQATALNIGLSSGARFTGQLKADNVTATQSSGGKMYLSGQVQSLSIHSHSGGRFYGFGMSADKCDAEVNSGGTAEITVTKELLATAHSGGKIGYRGDGIIKTISTSSGGKVTRG